MEPARLEMSDEDRRLYVDATWGELRQVHECGMRAQVELEAQILEAALPRITGCNVYIDAHMVRLHARNIPGEPSCRLDSQLAQLVDRHLPGVSGELPSIVNHLIVGLTRQFLAEVRETWLSSDRQVATSTYLSVYSVQY